MSEHHDAGGKGMLLLVAALVLLMLFALYNICCVETARGDPSNRMQTELLRLLRAHPDEACSDLHDRVQDGRVRVAFKPPAGFTREIGSCGVEVAVADTDTTVVLVVDPALLSNQYRICQRQAALVFGSRLLEAVRFSGAFRTVWLRGRPVTSAEANLCYRFVHDAARRRSEFAKSHQCGESDRLTRASHVSQPEFRRALAEMLANQPSFAGYRSYLLRLAKRTG